jgi:hypothetical protein
MIGNAIAGLYGGGAAPAAPTAYESIATVTSTGSSAILTFSSIPSTYKSLQIRGIYQGTGGFLMTLNNSAAATYATHYLNGNGTSATSGNATYSAGYLNFTTTPTGTTNTFHASVIDILDYSSTVKNKTLRIFDGYDQNGSGNATLWSGLWGNTSAITSIELDSNGTWVNGTTFALYGIKGA